LKAKIKATIKRILINAIDGRAEYKEINQLSSNVVEHAKNLYAIRNKHLFNGYNNFNISNRLLSFN